MRCALTLTFLLATSVLVTSVHAYSSDAVLTFTLDFPGSMPDHYSIRVQSDGKAEYQSRSKLSSESDDEDSFAYEFTVPDQTRQQMFELTAKAGYFEKELDARRKNIAFTGEKTLAYKDDRRSGERSFVYSANAPAQQLSNLFQNLSATLEYGHRLQYDHRYQKLALEEELKRLEETVHSKMAIDLETIAPILQQIVDDSSVINVSRARAQRLLQAAGK